MAEIDMNSTDRKNEDLSQIYIVHVDELRRKILDTMMKTGVVLGFPLILHICIRDFRLDNGVSWQMLIQVATYVLLVFAFLFRRALSYQLRASVILSMLLVSAYVGLFRLGVFSFAPITIFTCIVVTGILLNHRVAVVLLVSILLVYLLLATLTVSGFWNYPYSVEETAHSLSVWIGWIAAITTYAVVTLICIKQINSYMRQKTTESETLRLQLQEQNSLLQRKKTELEDAKKKLEKAMRVKDEFLGLMSHELRTPVNPILGMTRLLETSVGDDPINQERLSLIRVSAERLLHSIDHILDITSMDNGSVTLSPQWSSMDCLLERLAANYEIRARAKGLNLVIMMDGLQSEDFFVDVSKLLELLGELLSNAIRFSETGNVRVALEKLESNKSDFRMLRFTICDEGIGMKGDCFEHIQELFTQLDAGRARKFEGLGLGLAIVARLAAIMDATLTFQAEPSAGTKVVVDLEARFRQKPSLHVERSNYFNQFPKTVRILVAEDDLANQIYMRQLLESMNAEVAIAINGQEVVDHCSNEKFDAVLMDVSMPIMDGIEAARHIRKNGLNIHTPIIALSAHNMPDIQKLCHDGGMDHFLLKPVHAAEILDVLSDYAGF